MAQNDGQAQAFPDFYHDTHYMHGQKKWINEEAQKTHVLMPESCFIYQYKRTFLHLLNSLYLILHVEKWQEELVRLCNEQSQPSITSPLSEQQVSVQVLGKRSGYLKGFGIRTKCSLGPIQNQTGPDSEVLHLRQQVAEFSQQTNFLSQKTTFLENLVLHLAQRAGVDPNTVLGADGTSGGAEDATSPGMYMSTLIGFAKCFLLILIILWCLGISIIFYF